jgi:hypothetical protein
LQQLDPRTVANDADGAETGVAPTVRAKALKFKDETVADDADANSPALSSLENGRVAGWRARL